MKCSMNATGGQFELRTVASDLLRIGVVSLDGDAPFAVIDANARLPAGCGKAGYGGQLQQEDEYSRTAAELGNRTLLVSCRGECLNG